VVKFTGRLGFRAEDPAQGTLGSSDRQAARTSCALDGGPDVWRGDSREPALAEERFPAHEPSTTSELAAELLRSTFVASIESAEDPGPEHGEPRAAGSVVHDCGGRSPKHGAPVFQMIESKWFDGDSEFDWRPGTGVRHARMVSPASAG
jgi:hypothetical protein